MRKRENSVQEAGLLKICCGASSVLPFSSDIRTMRDVGGPCNVTIARSKSVSEGTTADVTPCEAVVVCYSAVDRFFPACGLYDLTEGIYHGDPAVSYEQAQANQHHYLLDQIECESGRRVLDIGCGYGTLLERIGQRGATGTGVTVCREQVAHCCQKKLDAHLLDYRAIPDEWAGLFDGVVANGSMEHFVQPTDAAAGRADQIYRDLFAKVHQLIDPNSPSRRFVTTTIHFVRPPQNPLDLLKSPFAFGWGTDSFHWAVLERGWGGYYPQADQLQHCAEGYFDLIEEVDGTEDYRLTSEEWLRRVRRRLRSHRVFNIAFRCLPLLVRSTRQFLNLMLYLFFTESWNWQFRPPNPPTRLLRQTWAYCE